MTPREPARTAPTREERLADAFAALSREFHNLHHRYCADDPEFEGCPSTRCANARAALASPPERATGDELPVCARHPEEPHRLFGDLNRCSYCGEPGTLLKGAVPPPPDVVPPRIVKFSPPASPEERGTGRGAEDDTDLLVDVWQQFSYRPNPDDTITMDGGLSTLEWVGEVLRARGRLLPCADFPGRDWWRVVPAPAAPSSTEAETDGEAKGGSR